MSELKHEQVLESLRSVQDPDLHQDLVTLGMIQNLEVQNGHVSLRVVLTTPACPLKAQIEADVRAAIQKLPGVKEIKVQMDAKVPTKAAPGGKVQSNAIPGVAQIIAVSSGKGGVGKSTVATNLAVSLAMEGARVGLLDADIYGPNIPTMMGVTEQPKLMQHPEQGEMFLPPSAHGVKVMSIGFLIDPDQPVVWRGPMLHNVLSQFCQKVAWGELDYLVMDLPPGTGDVQLSLAQLVPITGAVMVSTPQEVAMQDVRKAFAMFEKVRVPILGVVENMSYFELPSGERQYIFGKDGGEALVKRFKTELLGQIPLVQAVREGGDLGKPVSVSDRESAVTQAFREIARKTAQRISILSAEDINPAQIVQIGRFN